MMSNSKEVSGHVSLSDVEGQEHYGNLLNEKPPNQFEQLQFYYWDSLTDQPYRKLYDGEWCIFPSSMGPQCKAGAELTQLLDNLGIASHSSETAYINASYVVWC